MRHLLILLTFFLASTSSFAQSLQGWLIYFGNTQINESKFGIHHEVQLRDHRLIGDHNQTLIRVGGQYQFTSSIQGTLGYGFIHTESEGTPNNAFLEHRIYQEGVYGHNLFSTKLRHRVRLEERFIEGQDFRGRFRYCLFADVPLSQKGILKQTMYLSFYNEVFLNISDDSNLKAFDRNRAYVGLGYRLKDNLGLQLGYMCQNVGKNTGTNHALVSLHHKMKWN